MEPTLRRSSQTDLSRFKKRTHKKNRVFLYLWSSLLLLSMVATLLIYTTEPGHQLRLMIAGSILSSQHPQYAFFLLSKNEVQELKDLIAHPKSVRSTLEPLPKEYSSQNLVQIFTLDTANYTAKIMKVNDPTTIHLVGTRFKNKGEPLSDLIQEHGAIAGINAGGFEDDNGIGSGGQPLGIALGDSHILSSPSGSTNIQMLIGGFTNDGHFITGSYSISELLALHVTQAVSFGPQLMIDGVSQVTANVNAAYGWAPRTALGQAVDGSVILIITDGRYFNNKSHRGASMEDLVDIFRQYGVRSAFALDGGGSTTMIYRGELQLKPATFTDVGMRYLPNAFLVIPHENDGKFQPAKPLPSEDHAPSFSTQKPAPISNSHSKPINQEYYSPKNLQ